MRDSLFGMIVCAGIGSLVLAAPVWGQCDVEGVILGEKFLFAASSGQGAVGDVVGIDLSLAITDWSYPLGQNSPCRYSCVVCFDYRALEFLTISYSEYHGSLAAFTYFVPRPEAGFLLLYGFTGEARMEELLSSGVPFPLATLYFRIRAEAGGETTIDFCNRRIWNYVCLNTELAFCSPSKIKALQSIEHRPGIVRVLPGEATRPELPPVPPAAKVYPEPLDPASMDIRFELEAPATARPGAREVPVGIYVTSSHEFSGYMAAVRFAPEELRLSRVEEHIRPGLVKVDNEVGGCGILSVGSWTRVGREGERVRIATLYFDVAAELAGASEVKVQLGPFENFYNWVAIRYQSGVFAGQVPVTVEAAAVVVSDAVLALQVRPTRPGDVNLDYEVNVSDAVDILETLFQGAEAVICRGASDANGDGRMNLSDAIWILNGLFRGGALREDVLVYCD